MPLQDLDIAVLRVARTYGHTPELERAAAAYAKLGEHGACWIALGLAGALIDGRRGHRCAWLRGAGTVVAAYVANQALKFLVRRPRPQLPDLPPLSPVITQLSFPSAHATTAFAAARAYSDLAPAGALYTAAAAFAVNRPYLGVHYPSDVVAGALLGTVAARILAR